MAAAIHRIHYPHLVLQGTPEAAGALQGQIVAEIPPLAQFFTAPHPHKGALTPQQAQAAINFFEQHCPGLNEEIQGFATALNTPLEQIAYYAFTYEQAPQAQPLPGGACSQIAVLPASTRDGHLLVGRSYEFSHEMSDMRLVTTRLAGRPAHLGFSEVLFGRDDGLNEHGLCVTMSAGAPMAPVEPGGCTFWALIRTVLERCASVDEALEVIAGIPVSFNVNLLLADRHGQAAVAEIACAQRAVRRIDANSAQQYLIATNHFVHPDLRPYDLGRMWNSVRRYQTIETRLAAAAGQITTETLRSLLTDPLPVGLSGSDYRGFFGTLWSEIFDVTAGTVEICFGHPGHNPWYTFDLSTPPGVKFYETVLPDEPSEAYFWAKLPPGSNELG